MLFWSLLLVACCQGADLELLPWAGPCFHECARTKTLLLIRHAEGTHNHAERQAADVQAHLGNARLEGLHSEHSSAFVLLEAVSGRQYWDPELTQQGVDQATALGRRLEEEAPAIDVVVVSPFHRTMQTALLALGWLHEAPFVASDLLRERVAKYTCDGRETASAHRSKYNTIDFSSVSELDEQWEVKEMEASQLRARAARALLWLANLPDTQQSVAVVTHKHFLSAFLSLGSTLTSEETEKFENAEVRKVLLCDRRRNR